MDLAEQMENRAAALDERAHNAESLSRTKQELVHATEFRLYAEGCREVASALRKQGEEIARMREALEDFERKFANAEALCREAFPNAPTEVLAVVTEKTAEIFGELQAQARAALDPKGPHDAR